MKVRENNASNIILTISIFSGIRLILICFFSIFSTSKLAIFFVDVVVEIKMSFVTVLIINEYCIKILSVFSLVFNDKKFQ